MVQYDFDPERANNVAAAIQRHRAISPLFLAAEFGSQIVTLALARCEVPGVDVRAVANHFFGGSIKAAGLLTVADLKNCAMEALKQHHYDVVLVPREAFDHRQLDLRGESIAALALALALPVEAV